MFSGNFKMAVASLRQAKWRSLLTMLGIIIGISSVVTIVSLGEGLKSQLVGQTGSLGNDVITVRSGKLIDQNSGADGLNLLAFLNSSTLSAKDVSAIAKLHSTGAVVPMDFVTSSAQSTTGQADNLYVIGTSAQLPSVLRQKIAYGSFFSGDSGQNFVVIGYQVAQRLFGQLNPAGQSITIRGQQFIVQGVLAPAAGGLLSIAQTDFNSSVFMSFGAAQSLTGGSTNITQILVRAKNPAAVNSTIADINRTLTHTHAGQNDFSVLRQSQLLNLAGGTLNTITSFVSGIAAVSLLVGGIGIMDIMLVSVSERTREIGVRKALGATNRQILNQFLVEGLALTVCGGIIGVAASLLINLALRVYTHWQPAINWPVLALAVGVSIVIGLIFSAAPALKAARKDPINALRGE